MAYGLRWALETVWIGDGTGPMSPPSSQRLRGIQPTGLAGFYLVPGGDSPTQGNFNTVISGQIVTDMEALIAANLGTIQAWSTGGN